MLSQHHLELKTFVLPSINRRPWRLPMTAFRPQTRNTLQSLGVDKESSTAASNAEDGSCDVVRPIHAITALAFLAIAFSSLFRNRKLQRLPVPRPNPTGPPAILLALVTMTMPDCIFRMQEHLRAPVMAASLLPSPSPRSCWMLCSMLMLKVGSPP